MLTENEGKLRGRSSQYLHLLEGALYMAVGLLLAAAAIAVLFDATGILWYGIAQRTVGWGLQVLDQLLFVLVLVEILHTVRISIRAREILIEPFLIVGLIASVRRVLVITMQAAKLTEEGHVGSPDAVVAFHSSMFELGLLGILVLVFVVSISLLRRASSAEKLVEE